MSDPPYCLCLCAQHSRTGVQCLGTAAYRVYLTARRINYGPRRAPVAVLMCGPCTTWRQARGSQVVRTERL